jgi:short-chain Z-isoprenyl diphosphate synthase
LKRFLYRLYQRRLLAEVKERSMPRHLGLIQDGNRRYAQEAGISKLEGYRLAAAKTEEVLTWCTELEIPMVTLWWLSTENLSRDAEDVGAVVEVIERTMAEWVEGGLTERLGIRIRPIGELELLPVQGLAVWIARWSQRLPSFRGLRC